MKKNVLILMLSIVVIAVGLTAGCAKEDAGAAPENAVTEQNNVTSNEVIDAYMTSVKEQSDAIKTSLEQDILTQTDMNIKSMELSELWDGAVNYLLDELKNRLSEEEFAKLQNDQLVWEAEKEKAVQEAGQGFEGGSFYSYIVNSKAAEVTEERALELYEMLK